MSDDNTLLSRRQLLGLFGGATGAAIVGASSGQTDSQSDGNLYGGISGMADAYQVGDGMWKGPASARAEVPKQDGNTFIQTDAGENGDKYRFYQYNGGWSAQGWDLPSVSAEDGVIKRVYRTGTDGSSARLSESPTDGYTLAHFQDLGTNWTVSNNSTGTDTDVSATLDPDEPFGGLPSVYVEQAADARCAIERTFSTPIDLSDKDLSLVIKPEQLTDSSTPLIEWRAYVEDSAGNTAGLVVRLLFDARNQWFRLPLIWRDGIDIDAIDLTDITSVTFQLHSDNGPVSSWIADPRVHQQADKGTICFQLDDGDETHHAEALPRLRKYGFAGTAFVHTDEIGDEGSMDWEQLRDLEGAGFSVGSHGPDNTRLHNMTADEVEQALRESREALSKPADGGGTLRGSNLYWPPGGEWSQDALTVVSNIYDMSGSYYTGTANNGGGLRARGAMFGLPRAATGGDSLSEIKTVVDETVKFNALSNIGWHAINNPSDFEEIVQYVHEYVQSGDLRVVTFSQIEELWPAIQTGGLQW